MAEYKINQLNSFFAGNRGDLIVAEPGAFINAAVVSGILTRVDIAEAQIDESSKETLEGHKTDKKGK